VELSREGSQRSKEAGSAESHPDTPRGSGLIREKRFHVRPTQRNLHTLSTRLHEYVQDGKRPVISQHRLVSELNIGSARRGAELGIAPLGVKYGDTVSETRISHFTRPSHPLCHSVTYSDAIVLRALYYSHKYNSLSSTLLHDASCLHSPRSAKERF